MKEKILNTRILDDQLALFYLGQEGFIIKHGDTHIMIDGYLSDYVDRNCGSEKIRWIRRYPAPCSPDTLDFLDAVICTHAHYDHADPDTLSAVAKVSKNAVFIVPAPVVGKIASYGIDKSRIIGAKAGEEYSVGGVKIAPIPSAHEQLNFDENGDARELGYKLCCGDTTIYHAGDCCVYDGLIRAVGHADIAILPVNGRSYFKLSNNIVGNMDVYEAIELAQSVGAEMMIPVHFDLYDVNALPASVIASAMENGGKGLYYHIFSPGERMIYAK